MPAALALLACASPAEPPPAPAGCWELLKHGRGALPQRTRDAFFDHHCALDFL